MDVVSWTLGNTSYDQDKAILIDISRPNRSISASQARRLVRHIVAGLKATGLRTGDYVCILSYNHVFYPVLCLGIIGAGGCVTGGNPGHTISELAGQLKGCSPRFIITESQMYEKARAAANECTISSSNIYICDPVDQPLPKECRSWTELLQHGACDWVTLDSREAETTTAVLYSTSGTTGLPKAAMMSHAHCIDVASFIEQSSIGKPYEISRLVSLPLLHAFAAPIVHMSALREGIPTYLAPRFDPATFTTAIETFHITELPMVPAMLLAALASPLFTPARLASVRHIWTAGAPLSLSVQTQFRRLLHAEARIVPVYGMTECGWITSLIYPGDATDTTVGSPVPGLSLRIVDDAGRPVTQDDTPGELLVRPQHPTLGYVGDPAATAALYATPGWVRSGDIASMRAGRVYIVDRKKDLIKVRAWQVSPAELEAVLLLHPHVADVAVVGVPDATGVSGEVPHAFVVVHAGADEGSLQLRDIQAFMGTWLARYKCVEGVSFVPEIPRNGAGKILRRCLREGMGRGEGGGEAGVELEGLVPERGCEREKEEGVGVGALQPQVEGSVCEEGYELREEEKMGAGALQPPVEGLWGKVHHAVQMTEAGGLGIGGWEKCWRFMYLYFFRRGEVGS
ncbi:hypothetical protein MMC27_001787 [Xylographa pallens]|nr:hypothetical protein [Xylographa pallens]